MYKYQIKIKSEFFSTFCVSMKFYINFKYRLVSDITRRQGIGDVRVQD